MKLELRDYQIELAEYGLQGKNVIICAPTGSGKTHVAMRIAFDHLAKNPKHRVGFIVNVGHLVDQQGDCFAKFADGSIKVGNMSGAHNLLDTAVPLKRLITTNQVVVMTVAILLNALNESNEDDRLPSICEFSLLIFDECHHCDKNHPYNQLMSFYFKEKNDNHKIAGFKLPQIVGLTASPGTGKASRSEDAINHILGICARLDAHKLVKTEVNMDDLIKFQNNPIADIQCAKMRSTDFLNNELNQMMDLAETLLDSLVGHLDLSSQILDALKPSQPKCNRGGHKYTNYIGNMFNVFTNIVDDEIHKGVYACWWYLKVLNLSVTLNWLFCSTDAVNFVRRHLTYRDPSSCISCDDDTDELDGATPLSVEPTCEVEKILREALAEMLTSTEGKLGVPKFESENNVLATLKNIVVSQFNDNEDSRIIIFVKERSYATAMLHYLQTHGDLNCFGSKKLVGANASSVMEGQTHSQQRDSVKAFHEGDFKILVATTIAEEGLDIGKCNLVIRYAFVTNEIAMVQSKGRGRAMDSKYIVIVPEHENWIANKEVTNRIRDEMMMLAIKKINEMSETKYFAAIQAIQDKNELLRRIAIKNEEKRIELEKKNIMEEKESYHLHCVQCRAFACSSESLRLAQGMHVLSLDDDLLLKDRIHLNRTSPVAFGKNGTYQTLGQFQCANCKHAWGTLCNIDKVTYPNMNIKNFQLKRVQDGTYVPSPKKWKDTQQYFSVVPLANDDIMNRVDGRLGISFKLEKN